MNPKLIAGLLIFYLACSALGAIFDQTGVVGAGGADTPAGLAAGLYAPEFTRVLGVPFFGDLLGGIKLSWEYFELFFKACQADWGFFGGIFGWIRNIFVMIVGAIFVWVAITLLTSWRGIL